MALINVKPSRLLGFTLIEVVLALGVFLVSVLALIGLLAPMLQSIDEVEKIDEITSVVSTVSAFLQSSTEIAGRDTDGNITTSKFDTIFNSVEDDGYATVFVFRQYLSDNSTNVQLQVGFDENDSEVDPGGQITDFSNAAGPIYRVVLTPSSALPLTGEDLSSPGSTVEYRSAKRDENTGTYSLSVDLTQYSEGSFAMEARIFAEDPPAPGGTFANDQDLEDLVDTEPDFSFNVAIVR